MSYASASTATQSMILRLSRFWFCSALVLASSCANVDAPFASSNQAEPAVEPLLEVRIGIEYRLRQMLRAKDLLRAAVREAGGYFQTASEGSELEAHFEARIPISSHDRFEERLKALGSPLRRSEDAAERSQERADLQARLLVARTSEERLLALARRDSTSLADLLSLETHLTEVRTRIERMQAEERSLQTRVGFASYDLRFASENAHREEVARTLGTIAAALLALAYWVRTKNRKRVHTPTV